MMKKTPVKLGGAFTLALVMLLSLVLALPAMGSEQFRTGYGGYQIPDPSIDIEKEVSVDGGNTWFDADSPTGPEVLVGNETVFFRFTVTNTGDVTLSNITLSDTDFDAAIGAQCLIPAELAPGASFQCVIGPFVAIEGQHNNTATATGDYDSQTYSDSDDANYLGIAPVVSPSIDIEKYVSVDDQATWHDADTPPGPEVSAGNQTIWFKFVVTNDGDVTLTNVTLSDTDFDAAIAVQCTVPTELNVGESFECVTGPFVAIEGQHTNTATATGDYDSQTYSDTDDAKYFSTVREPGSIEVTKTADPTEVTEPGGLVNFSVRVDNTSAIDSVTIDSLTDSIYGDLNGQGDCSCPQTIPASGYYECGFSATVSGNAGSVETNVVTASGTDDDANPVSDDDDATVTVTDLPSAIEVIKTASPDQITEPGENVTYTFTINNLSAVDTVTIDSLNDSIFGDLNGQGDCACPQTIPSGGSYTCSFTAYDSGNAGDTYTNVVTASGIDDDGNPVSDDDDATVIVIDVPSAIEVIKTASPDQITEPGDDVTYTFTINNLSAVDTVTIDSLSDSIFGDLNGQGDCACPQTIPAGGSYTCSVTVYVSGNGGDTHTNVITASGIDDDGNPVSDDDDATVTVVTPPCPPGPDSATIVLNDDRSSTYTITFVSHIGNTWTYFVEEISGRDLSHWDLGINTCLNNIVSSDPPGAEIGTDGSTGFVGIKWDIPNDSWTSGEFSFTLDGDYPAGTVEVLAKAGTTHNTAYIIGPICDGSCAAAG